MVTIGPAGNMTRFSLQGEGQRVIISDPVIHLQLDVALKRHCSYRLDMGLAGIAGVAAVWVTSGFADFAYNSVTVTELIVQKIVGTSPRQ